MILVLWGGGEGDYPGPAFTVGLIPFENYLAVGQYPNKVWTQTPLV